MRAAAEGFSCRWSAVFADQLAANQLAFGASATNFSDTPFMQ